MMSIVNKSKLLLCALLLLLAGCEDQKSKESIIGNQDKPVWTVPENYDMTSSMTAIVKVDLTLTYPTQVKDGEQAIAENDLLAAFVGEECVGVTSPIDGLFYLYIAALNGQSDSGEAPQVKLRYYSSILKNTFDAQQTVPFKNDAQLGTVSDPYKPEFRLPK